MHKKAAYCLLVGGFLWICALCAEFVPAPHRDFWVRHSNQLPETATIPRDAATRELRSLQKALDHYYGQLLIAGFLMLVGGVVNGIHLKPRSDRPSAVTT